MPEKPKFHSVHIVHPQHDPSYVRLTVDRRLRSGKLDDIPLSEDELIKLIAQASQALVYLRGIRS